MNPWLGLLLAGGLGYLAFWLYRRETRGRGDRLRWLLPLLRGTAVFLAVLALTGPVLHHERVIRELGKLFVFVDGSKSMEMTDESMPPERKVAAMQAMGMLPRSKAFREASDASAHLARARFVAEKAIDAGAEAEGLKDAASEFADHIESAFDSFEKLTGELTSFSAAPGLLLAQRYRSDDRFFDRNFRLRSKDHPEPQQTRYLDSFRFPQTTDVDFTLWMRGYLRVPADGKYRFWISSDDKSELWLSRDDSPQRAERIARMDDWTEEFNYDASGAQRSREFTLERGRRYYIEAILEGGTGENHLSVAWQLPGNEKREAPIPGEFFIPVAAENASSDSEDRLAHFSDQLLKPAVALNKQLSDGKGDPFAHIETLGELNDLTTILSERLREYVLSSASAYFATNRDKPDFDEKMTTFDSMGRKGRIERILLREDGGVLSKLAEQQDVEFVALRGSEADSLWWQRRGGRKKAGPLPYEIRIAEPGAKTDIGELIKETVGDAGKGIGVLIFSDGQHNVGTSPVASAEVLGKQGIPVFAVGTGTLSAPEDMAVVDVVGPETVFSKDRVKGTIAVRDTLRTRQEFEVKIESDGETVWSETFDSSGIGEREFEYDFSVESLVTAFQEKNAADGTEFNSVPLDFKVSVAPAGAPPLPSDDDTHTDAASGDAAETEGEEEANPLAAYLADNDSKPLSVQAIAQARKILLLDARPRWETRYLHNMFERDEQWEVNAIMEVFSGEDDGRTWERGDGTGSFPDSREELFKYESVFIGDVPRRLFRDEELQWLVDFVETRGGGIVFVDGQRGNLRSYTDTKLGKLLPVEWLNSAEEDRAKSEEEMPEALALTTVGAEFAPLRFASSGTENEEIWARLRPPHWSASVRALPGTEVFAKARFRGDGDGRESPALVLRRSGAGRVLYCATDELWRWRYNVADRYHQKFWVQIANWIGEKPFAVAGRRTSIGADKLVYAPGESAELRVRIRDESGDPVSEGDYVALLYDADDLIAAEIELEVDENGGGVFRGRSGELESGEYKIAVRKKYFLGDSEEFDARASLVVRAAVDRELDDLTLDAELLKNVARSSGGQFFHEEEVGNLVNLLESIDRKKVIPSQTVLWSSYWWFIAIIGLLTAEWILRKRAGFV